MWKRLVSRLGGETQKVMLCVQVSPILMSTLFFFPPLPCDLDFLAYSGMSNDYINDSKWPSHCENMKISLKKNPKAS